MPADNPVTELLRRQALLRDPTGSYQDRYEIFEGWACGRPILQADLDPSTINQAAVRLLTGCNRAWKLSGTNAANAGSVMGGGSQGGIVLTTAGALNDQMILSPSSAINSIDLSNWRYTNWRPSALARFEAQISLPSIAAVKVHVGFGLSEVLDLTTDADQAKFAFNTAGAVSTANWTACASIAGTDTETDSEEALAANTLYRLGVWFQTNPDDDTEVLAEFYVNGTKVHTTGPVTQAINLLPFLGIEALAASAKSIYVHTLRCSRTIA
ncbi:MAG: hypothetical protein IT442_04925 [Phycisphaeraceae bacterium]|nr:hypothetical protein [Phycisphaeraceae bacterium]